MNKKTAKSGKDRLQKMRAKRAKLGQKRIEYYLTDKEKTKVDGFIEYIRSELNSA